MLLRVSGEKWFQQVLEYCMQKFIGNPKPLTELDLTHVASTLQITLPHDLNTSKTVEYLNWRIRGRRSALKPKFRKIKRAKIRLKDYEQFLTEIWRYEKPTLRKTLRDLKKIYLPYLKQNFSRYSYLGLRNLSDPWSLRILLFEKEYFDGFAQYCTDNKISAEETVHILKVKNLILNTTSSIRLSRSKKHNTGSSEIEAALSEYLEIPSVYTSARTTASETRRLIQTSGIKSLEELLSLEGQKKIASLEYEGKIGQYAMSRPRICLRWIFEKYQTAYPAYFGDLSEEGIFDLSKAPEINVLIEKAWGTLGDYQNTNLNKLKSLFRLLLRTSSARNRKEFYDMPPSNFIIAALDAEHHDNYLQSFRAIRMFRLAFLERLPRIDQWPEHGSHTFKKFTQDIQKSNLLNTTTLGTTLRLSEFEFAFSKDGIHWGAFFKILQGFYYRIADAHSENNDASPNFLIAPDDFHKTQSFVTENFYGQPCSSRKYNAYRAPNGKWHTGGIHKKRNLTDEDKRDLEFLTGYAFQAAVACRFANEADRVVFSEQVPRLISVEGPHKLFWWPEKNCYAVLFSKSRKNQVSYLAPLNDIADALIKRFLQVSPKKHGERIFNYNIQRLVDEIKKMNVQVYKASCSFNDFMNGVRLRGITPHSMRHILRQYIESHYTGADKELIQTVALGHKIPRDTKNRSSAAGYYGDDLNYSVAVFDQLRRIKNGVVLTSEQLELQKLREEILKSDKKTRKQLKESVDRLNDKADVNIAVAKANLLATLLASNEDFQSDVLLKMLQQNPQILLKILQKKDSS